MRGAGVKAVLAAAVVAVMAAAWIAPSAAAETKQPLSEAPIGTGLDDASAPKLPWPEPTPEIAPLTLMADARLFRRPDGSMVLGAVRWGHDQQSYWLAYLGADGLAQREVAVPLSENEFPADAIATRDGGFLLFSWIRELWLIRLDPDGQRLWSRKLDDYEISDGFSPTAAQLSDGSFLIGGSSAGPDRGRLRYRMSRIAPDGTIVWERSYGRLGERSIAWLIPFSNRTTMVGASDDLFAVDLQGRTLWQRPRGLLIDLSPSPDDTIVAIERNMSGEDWPARPRFSLVRLDHNGRSLWRRPHNLRTQHQTELHLGHMISMVDSGVLLPIKRIFDLPPSIGADGIRRSEREVSTVSILRYDSRGRRVWGRTIIGVEERGDGSDDVELVDAAVLGNGMLLVIGHGPKGDRDDFSSWWMRALPYN